MGQYVLLLVVALTVGAVVFGVSVLLSGSDPGLSPAEPDGRAIPLPGTRPLVESDITGLRFDTALRGYRMAQVDRALRRAAYDIGYKDELIGVLEAEVSALRDGRTADAEALRRAREAALAPAEEKPAEEKPAGDKPAQEESLAGTPGDGQAPDGREPLAGTPDGQQPLDEEPVGEQSPDGAVPGGGTLASTDASGGAGSALASGDGTPVAAADGASAPAEMSLVSDSAGLLEPAATAPVPAGPASADGAAPVENDKAERR